MPDTCAATQRVTVATNATMAEVLQKIPVDPQDCITLNVNSDLTDSEIAFQIASNKNAPNLWIPDSSTRAQMTLEDQSKVVTRQESLAKSPGIVVTANDASSYETWNQALGDSEAVSMGDPKINSGAFIALMNAAAEASNGTSSTEELTTNTGLRAQTIGVDSPAQSSEELLNAVKNGEAKAAIVAESDYANFLAANDAETLKASVPASGTGELDYPLYQLASNETNKTISAAADKIHAFLETEDGKKALAEAGLRGANDEALSDISVGSVTAPELTAPELVASTWRSYALQSAPMNALVAVDTSGSMSWTIGDSERTRMEVTLESLLAGSQLFPARDSMGLWTFSERMSTDANGVELPYKELVPVRGFEEQVEGKSQRDILQENISTIEPDVEKGTALNDTLIAQFKNIKGNYQADAANVVILITDGENNTPGSPSTSTEDTIAQIQAEQDPDAPVYFVLIGVSEDANMDALRHIAQNVGGEAYSANSPSDIQRIFQEGLTSIAQQGSQGAEAPAEALPLEEAPAEAPAEEQ